jgi:predicted DNA-binding ribbon-helix-helix protein
MAAAFIWAVGLTDCVIFATLQNLFLTATVQDDFSVWMSRIYYKWGRFMKSLVIKRSVVVAGHKTSVSLEDAFWKGLKEIAAKRHMTLSELVGAIDSEREYGNLSSALRLFVLEFYRSQISDLKEGRDGSDQGSETSGAVRMRRMAQARH